MVAAISHMRSSIRIKQCSIQDWMSWKGSCKESNYQLNWKKMRLQVKVTLDKKRKFQCNFTYDLIIVNSLKLQVYFKHWRKWDVFSKIHALSFNLSGGIVFGAAKMTQKVKVLTSNTKYPSTVPGTNMVKGKKKSLSKFPCKLHTCASVSSPLQHTQEIKSLKIFWNSFSSSGCLIFFL